MKPDWEPWMILVTGGTGFVGDRIVARLLSAGKPVRVLAHARGDSPGAEIVRGDIRDLSAVSRAARECRAVVHLVGIIRERGEATFRRMHVDATRIVIQACQQAGVPRLLHMSALGARSGARSRYHRTKWEAEELVRVSGLPATILRPSVIFGPGGGFLAELRKLVRGGPVIPIVGRGMSLLQPVWVEDVAACFAHALDNPDTIGHAYGLGGPETFGLEPLIELIAEVEGIRKPRVHLPVPLVRLAAATLGRLSSRFPLAADQLTMLLEDSVCDITPMQQTLGVNPEPLSKHVR